MGGLFDKVIPLSQQVVALDPANGGAYVKLLLSYSYLGRFNEAIAVGDEYLRKLDENPDVHGWIAICYHSLGNFEEARIHYERCLSLASDFFPCHRHLGVLYRQNGQPEKARELWLRGSEILKRMLDVNPENPRLRAWLATFYASLGDRDAVLREEAPLLRDAPANVLGLLAWAHADLGEPERAIELLQRALLLNPGGSELVVWMKASGVEYLQQSPRFQQYYKNWMDSLDRLRAQY